MVRENNQPPALSRGELEALRIGVRREHVQNVWSEGGNNLAAFLDDATGWVPMPDGRGGYRGVVDSDELRGRDPEHPARTDVDTALLRIARLAYEIGYNRGVDSARSQIGAVLSQAGSAEIPRFDLKKLDVEQGGNDE